MPTDHGRRPTPAQITIALDYCGLYGPEVDVALGGVEPMVDEWESGKRLPSAEQVQALADLTGFTAEFFYLPSPPPGVSYVCIRSGRGRGCHRIDTRPDAELAPLTGQLRLPL